MSSTEELQALRDATAAMQQAVARLDALESGTSEQIDKLREHVDKEFHRLEAQMGTMNAHLDNIAREVSIANAHHETTNRLMEEDMRDRKEDRRLRRTEEAEEKGHARQMEIEKHQDKKEVRGLAVSAAKEGWEILKHPLGYLIAAMLGYIAWHFFGAPLPQQAPAPLPEAHQQVEADE